MTNNSENIFFQTYFDYVGKTEVPLTYHRWAATTAVASIIGRQAYFPFGHAKMFPNLYTLLTGSAGARKSTAIGIASKVLKKSGYHRFAPNKCSKEQFLKSMSEEDLPVGPNGEPLDLEQLLDTPVGTRNELLIAADEFPDFIGQGNTEFTTMLTTLWDGKDTYTHPKLNSQDVIVSNPLVNALCGCTPEGFSMAFPPEVVGQGFTSRLLFIYSEPSTVKIPWPLPPDPKLTEDIVGYLAAIGEHVKGEMSLTTEAEEALEIAYQDYVPLADPRFVHYNTRRFTMLLKLSTVLAAMDLTTTVDLKHALQANTMLHFAECRMHKALGEYGRSRSSEQQSLVLDILGRAHEPLHIAQLWQKLSTEISRQTDLVEIIKNLALAHKIKTVETPTGAAFVRVHEVREVWNEALILPDFLELEEMD